jgi:hypothetical protein
LDNAPKPRAGSTDSAGSIRNISPRPSNTADIQNVMTVANATIRF